MKVCCTCKQKKAPDQFHKNRSQPDGLQKYCKACRSDSDRKHYRKHRTEKRAKLKQDRMDFRAKLDALKEEPCVDCGQRHPTWAMSWDHIEERGPKEFELGAIRQSVKSWKKVIAEVGKCDLVCSNCHMVRTWARQYPEDYLSWLQENPDYPRPEWSRSIAR